VHRDESGELEFSVNIAFEFTPKAVATETILGIDRGAAKIGSATVINAKGQVIAAQLEVEGTAFSSEMARIRKLIAERQKKGYRAGRQFKLRGRKADAIVGEYANRIVEIAKTYRSQIAIEKINAVSMSGFLTQSQFTKLKSSLTYKAERVGLPAPLEVPAAYTSQTCAKCVHTARENRPKRDSSGKSIQGVFRCVSCGYEANADDNASEVIALRALHQQIMGGKFQKFEKFKIWLAELGRENFRSARA
jgi:putative transposase